MVVDDEEARFTRATDGLVDILQAEGHLQVGQVDGRDVVGIVSVQIHVHRLHVRVLQGLLQQGGEGGVLLVQKVDLVGGDRDKALVGQMGQIVNLAVLGEGNGGVIYPELHYGRDALVGIALFLTYLAKKQMKVSELRKTYPAYFMAKNRIDLTPDVDVDAILVKVKEIYANEEVNDIDGVKIDFADSWVHLRKSNTEPIIRIYSEAANMDEANQLAQQIKDVINSMI